MLLHNDIDDNDKDEQTNEFVLKTASNVAADVDGGVTINWRGVAGFVKSIKILF